MTSSARESAKTAVAQTRIRVRRDKGLLMLSIHRTP
jgi:hypothetical protein